MDFNSFNSSKGIGSTYFSLLPNEMFYEIVKHIHTKETYLNFISFIKPRITNTDRLFLKSGLCVDTNLHDQVTESYLLPDGEYHSDFMSYRINKFTDKYKQMHELIHDNMNEYMKYVRANNIEVVKCNYNKGALEGDYIIYDSKCIKIHLVYKNGRLSHVVRS